MRKILGGLLLFGLGVVVGTTGSDDTLLQQARQQADQAYDQGVADATVKFHSIAVQAGYATWEPDLESHQPTRFVWKQSQINGIAEAEDAHYLVPAFWQPDPGQPPQRVMLRSAIVTSTRDQ